MLRYGHTSFQPRISRGFVCFLFYLLVGSVPALYAAESLLTRIADVRSLSVAEAEQGREARITGIVVYVERSGILVQDETGSTFFRPNEQQMFLRVGDEIEVHGITQMGRYLAGLGPSEVRVLRRGQNAPAIPVGFDDVVFNRYFYQRVAVEGIVRCFDVKNDWIALRLAMGSHILEIRFAQSLPPSRKLVDARVRIKGISAGSINDQRQVVETFLRIQSWDDIEVLDPAVPDELVPHLAPSELLSFHPLGRPERRIAVAGTVTAVYGDREIYLQEGTTAFAARLTRHVELSVGDRIELIGFAEIFQFAASVVDAEVWRRVPGISPEAIAIGSLDLLNALHDAQLVAVEARVADAFQSPDGYTLVLSGNNRSIQGYVPGDEPPPLIGSKVRVQGICRVEVVPSPSFVRAAGTIYLRARSPDDVTVLESPGWWTPRKLIVALGVLACVTSIVGIWIGLLHWQVRRKTIALRGYIESEAALEERQRIAQEFHDTLEQDLTGLALRLDTAATRAFDEKGRQIVVTSRRLLARIQVETKNIISNLRNTDPLETDLATTLDALVKNCADLSGIEVRLQTGAEPPPLAGSILHHLHMMARESVNNAIKHASATQITIYVTIERGRLVMRISDNGCGFDVDLETKGKSGHFGCIGIRERARKICATVSWHSAPNQGAVVEILMPMPAPVLGSSTVGPKASLEKIGPGAIQELS